MAQQKNGKRSSKVTEHRLDQPEWGEGGQYTPGAPDAFCKLMGLSKAISWQCCGGACGNDVECHFTTCEKWYINGAWTDGNCDGASYDVFTTIVCAVP